MVSIMTYPICVNASNQGVLNIIIDNIFINDAVMKHVIIKSISFLMLLDVIVISFILGILLLYFILLDIYENLI